MHKCWEIVGSTEVFFYIWRLTHLDQIDTQSHTEIALKCKGGQTGKHTQTFDPSSQQSCQTLSTYCIPYQDTGFPQNTIWCLLMKQPLNTKPNKTNYIVRSCVSYKSYRRHSSLKPKLYYIKVTLIFQNMGELACVNWMTCHKLTVL